ncbi:hypothetical protein CRENBAI_004896 [Crenichthys baileyi]|uniref:Uncharacterized protein n=1 Tax=Crenichthys baileyi TaxID=28760 RepID=A0AAV9QRW8_9TELE
MPRPMGAQRGGEKRYIGYSSIVPWPASDASPAQSAALQHPLVHGVYTFHSSATAAGCLADALLPGLQRRVTEERGKLLVLHADFTLIPDSCCALPLGAEAERIEAPRRPSELPPAGLTSSRG